MKTKKVICDFRASTTHPGIYRCTYLLIGGVWLMAAMEKIQ